MNSGQKNHPTALAESEVLVPQWPVPAGVGAVFTTRHGGTSGKPWDSLNLGSHVGDAPSDVEANRTRLRNYLEQRGARRTVFLDQVHGTEVLRLNGGEGEPGDGSCADASLATQPGVACTIMVADCLPVLLATRDGRAVTAAHAGWRGLAGRSVNGGPPQGILEAAVTALRKAAAMASSAQQQNKQNESDIIAWLGPCIGPTAFEVGEDVRAAFGIELGSKAHDYFKPTGTPGKYWANLPGLARWRLAQAGVSSLHGNDGSEPWCTFSQPEKYFSHRRDAARLGSTGRMAACVWLASD